MEMRSDSVGPIYRERQQPRAVIGWLGTHPDIRNQPQIINHLLDDLIALLTPYGLESVYSREPRTYRLTSRGRTQLAEGITLRRIHYLLFLSTYPNMAVRADAEVQLGVPQIPEVAATISLRILPETDDAIPAAVSQVTAFVQKWFEPLDAIAAFVSPQGKWADQVFDDTPLMTSHERNRSYSLADWTNQRRFLRGAFWGNGLGPELCERLGGRERVLRDAPVFRAESIGDGVWLRLTDEFPPSQTAIDQLSVFLSPLLRWTKDDLIPRATSPDMRSISRESVQETDEFAGDASHPMVPIRGLDTIEDVDVAINISLDHPPTAEQHAEVQSLFKRWYTVGFNGGFGGNGFHSLSDLSIDGSVVRCNLDAGSADILLAFDSLRKRLAALPDIQVRELVLGIEVVD